MPDARPADLAAFDALVDELCSPGVERIETHASVVLLAAADVYKLKKPVDFGFLDYSTLAQRKHMCDAEVALNARLAPGVYLGVEPIVRHDGRLHIGGPGAALEYAVHMRRLPDEARLGERLARAEVTDDLLDRLAARIAGFHAQAQRGAEISALARHPQVVANCEQNFEQIEPFIGWALSFSVYERLRTATRRELEARREQIEQRAQDGMPCDTHGDLRLEHIYLFPDRSQPHDVIIVDCIEFNDRFRYADPVCDFAFLTMDMQAHAATKEAQRLANAYFAATGDARGRELMPLYTAYRATVRGKVRALQAAAMTSRDARRVLQQARAHLLQALVELEPSSERPCVVLMCGLPGTGKSVVARGLAERSGFEVVRSDIIRKQLAGLAPEQSAGSAPAAGIYSAQWTERTYQTCLQRAQAALFEGQRVIVDATFRTDAERERFVEMAHAWGVPIRILLCEAAPEVVRERLEQRRNDASDADWNVYLHMRDVMEPFGRRTSPVVDRIDTHGGLEVVTGRAASALARTGLAASDRDRVVRTED